jgi:hypothetical protein
LDDEQEGEGGTMEVPLFQKSSDDYVAYRDQPDIAEVEVFADCWDSVEAFRLCPIVAVGAGMAGVIWMGINPSEIYAACRLLKVARSDWDDIARDVVYMGNEVADLRNKRQVKPTR